MFHPHETGCNGHVSVHGNCVIERLTSRAYTFVRKRREQVCTSVLVSNTFHWVSELESKGKVVCYIYAYIEKKSRNGGIRCTYHQFLEAER